MSGILRTSRMLDDILNRVPLRSAPYGRRIGLCPQGGLHASAIMKDPTTYEHIDPALVGNERLIPMSNQAGSRTCGRGWRRRGSRSTRRTRAWAASWRW